MSIKNAIILRTRIAFLAIFIFTLLIIGRIVMIQYFSGGVWETKAKETDVRLMTINATRGNIYSDDGSLLATSLPFYYVALDPMVSQRTEARRDTFDAYIGPLCDSLAAFFNDKSSSGYEHTIRAAVAQERQYLRLNSRMVNYHEKKRMETWPLFNQGRMKGGVIFEKEERRFKPFSQLAFRTIGYVKDEERENGRVSRIGAGIEKSFDSLLAGQNGQAWFENIGNGRWKPIHNEEEVKPRHGLDLHTTIDINIQDVAEEALLKALRENEADNGCAVVMEVATGKIKAMANLDKITKEDGSFTYRELYNYAVGKRCEPGSTVKLASMMAILEERPRLGLQDTVHIGKRGVYKFHDRICRDAHRVEQGYLTVEEIFAESSNIGTAKLAYELFYEDKVSQQRFVDYLNEFGLGQKLNFQLMGEAVPSIKDPSDPSWSGISIPWMSHGYELEVSPLQILAFYNGVANDGKMIQPVIADYVADADKMVSRFEPKVINNKMCSDKTLEKLQKMLASAVEYGTAKNIRTENYPIAGKTGTAKRLVDGRYTSTYYTSFVGYFPADAPKYSIIVTVDNPTKGRIYGSQVAAPVFREIADKIYVRDKDLHEVLATKFETEKGVFPVVRSGRLEDLMYLSTELGLNVWKGGESYGEFVTAKRDDELQAIKWVPQEIKKGEVPDVTGMTLRDALPLLENAGLQVEYNQMAGRVMKQSHVPGSRLIVGSHITLEIGS